MFKSVESFLHLESQVSIDKELNDNLKDLQDNDSDLGEPNHLSDNWVRHPVGVASGKSQINDYYHLTRNLWVIQLWIFIRSVHSDKNHVENRQKVYNQ